MPELGDYRRDQVTWTGFSLMGTWAALLYLIGPAAAVIGEDLGFAAAATGSIGTALALGIAASALLGPLGVRRWGRRRMLRGALLVLSASVVLLALGVSLGMVLVAVMGIGALGATVANTATAVLSDSHRHHAARAITEANAVASWLGVFSPALLGLALTLPTGWRGAAAALSVLPLLAMRRVRWVPEPDPDPAPAPAHVSVASSEVPRRLDAALPRAFWLSLLVVGAAVALEFSINFWAVPLLQERTGATLAAAAAALSAVTLGMALGRTFAAGLSARFPLPGLIVVCFLIAATGLAGLLLSGNYATSLVAMFACGLGLSLLFPCAQSWALGLAGSGADRAVAFTALPVALAIGVAPFLLGVLAQVVGLTGAMAFGFVIAMIGVGAVGLVLVLVRRDRTA